MKSDTTEDTIIFDRRNIEIQSKKNKNQIVANNNIIESINNIEKNNAKVSNIKNSNAENTIEENIYEDVQKRYNMDEKPKKTKKKRLWQKIILILFIISFILVLLGSLFLFLFFKTELFQEYKELWVETAMTTMNHQYLATWFLSDDEINEILRKNEIVNKENSTLHMVAIEEEKKENEIHVDKITGSGYVGFVMTVSDPTKVKMVDARKKNIGTKLSEICEQNNAIAGINASGFADPNGNGLGNIFNEPVIINKQLLYGNASSPMNLIGFSARGELILGRYTYQEALNVGIESGVQFGPYLIVNGKNQINKSNAGGLHPRMAVGQKKDGTMIFVCIDGRQPGYSVGTTLLELQNIFVKYGAYNAANLDGGSSATMYYDGKIVNKTSTPIGERYLPDAIIVTK